MRSLLVASLALVSVIVACSSSDSSNPSGSSTSGGTSSGSSSAKATNCESRCEAKATACGAPASEASSQCGGYCASATEADLTCVEGASCSALVKSEGRCPSGSGSSSSSSGTASSSGSSSSSGSTVGCHSGSLSVADCAACANSDDAQAAQSSYPLCTDKGSTGNQKTCRNRVCCLGYGDECSVDGDCCSNTAYSCKDTGAGKKCST